MKLSEKIVAKLTRETAGREVVFDDALPGFGVRVKPSGHKAYIIQYRTRAGTSRRLTLGAVTVLRLEQARARARKLLVQVGDGADPAQERSDERAENAEEQHSDGGGAEAEPSTTRRPRCEKLPGADRVQMKPVVPWRCEAEEEDRGKD